MIKTLFSVILFEHNGIYHYTVNNKRNYERQNKPCIVVHKVQSGINGTSARLIIGFLTSSHITKIKRLGADSDRFIMVH